MYYHYHYDEITINFIIASNWNIFPVMNSSPRSINQCYVKENMGLHHVSVSKYGSESICRGKELFVNLVNPWFKIQFYNNQIIIEYVLGQFYPSVQNNFTQKVQFNCLLKSETRFKYVLTVKCLNAKIL